MKLLNLIIAFLAISSFNSYAQKSNQPFEVKAEKNIYVYTPSTTGSRSLMTVRQKNNSTSPSSSNNNFPIRPLTSVEYTSLDAISKSVYEAFTPTRIKELSDERIIVKMFVNPAGKIINMEYFVSVKTKITPVEFEKLEKAVKGNISLQLAKEDKERGEIATAILIIPLKKIADGTFPN